MVRQEGNGNAANNVHIRVITGRDGKPAFALLPIEAFVALLAYARKGSEEASDEAARKGLLESLWKDVPALGERLVYERLYVGHSMSVEKRLASILADVRLDETLEEMGDWLGSVGDTPSSDWQKEPDDTEDVAAYDAATARAEEGFPSEIADRLIAGDSPIKVFREYRGLTQHQLAKQAGTRAPYVSQIETGRRTGSVKLLHRLAEVLGVGLDDLM